ncbi:MAG: hypothetical protein HQK52_21760, partial [Oligoflexia bacterium]|nr:hypothetical protein [Oligoflexia bacterium]
MVVNILALVKKEKGYTLAIIEHLEEIESRHLHLELGFPSMFAYITKSLGYSENEGQQRLSCMRLARTIPEIKEKISEGSLTLTNIGLAAASLKRQEETKGEKLTIEEKTKVIETVTNKSTRQAKIELEAMEGGAVTKKAPTYKIEVSEKAWKLLQELKGKMGNYQDGELLELLLQEKAQELTK